jgi:hypothetical protein
MSTILRDSGAFQSKRTNNNVREIDNALQELQAKQVLMAANKTIIRGPLNKVVDIRYTLMPDINFVQEVKKANLRAHQQNERMYGKQNLLSHPSLFREGKT